MHSNRDIEINMFKKMHQKFEYNPFSVLTYLYYASPKSIAYYEYDVDLRNKFNDISNIYGQDM